MKKLVVVGGSDAGISAALRAKEIDPATQVTVVVGDRFPNFSVCGLPFLVSGEVPDVRRLAHRPIEQIERAGIHLLLQRRVAAVDPDRARVVVEGPRGVSLQLDYDRLVICTGAAPIRPEIPGLHLTGVFFLRSIGDGLLLRRFIESRAPASAAVIGGGYIGMEMADALTLRGMEVTVLESADTVLTTLDKELGEHVGSVLSSHGVSLATRTRVTAITENGNKLRLLGDGGFRIDAGLVLVAAGVRPEADLAVSVGADTGAGDAIKVSQRMETSIPGVYAAGDCVETWHRVLEKPAYMPLGTTAHKQGRVAGENAAGGSAEFSGSVGTQVVKIFDHVAARTGLRVSEASLAGFSPVTIQSEWHDHNAYYPGAQPLTVRVTGDRATGRLLGAQIVGYYGSEIAKRIDVFATAIHGGLTVAGLCDLDLSYTPPLGGPWDPVQAAAQRWLDQAKE